MVTLREGLGLRGRLCKGSGGGTLQWNCAQGNGFNKTDICGIKTVRGGNKNYIQNFHGKYSRTLDRVVCSVEAVLAVCVCVCVGGVCVVWYVCVCVCGCVCGVCV